MKRWIKMNVTLILYESKYGTGKTIANTLCPILGPAKSFDINEHLFVHNEPISMEEFRKFSEKEINVLIFIL